MRSVLMPGAIALLVALAAGIDGYVVGLGGAADDVRSGDIVYRMLGELREVVSAAFVLKADEYYHGGTRHAPDDHCAGEAAPCDREDHDHSHHEQPHGSAVTAAGRKARDIWQWLYQEVHYRPVSHLAGAARAEALPWFYLATRVNPHNVNAYVVGGYWLGQVLQQPDDAIVFLQQGLEYNPGDWQINSQLGDIYFIVRKDYPRAAAAFRRAYEALPADIAPQELRHILTLLGAAAERSGRQEEADTYRVQLDALFPGP